MSSVRQVTAADSGSNPAAGQTPIGESGSGEVCLPNISRRERRKRLVSGIVAFGLALGVLAVLIASGASTWWRLLLFPLFAAAASGFFQWRDKT